MIYEIDLLNHDNLNYINDLYNKANFFSGNITNKNPVKNNQILVDSVIHTQLTKYINQIIVNNQLIYNVLCLKKTTPLYFLKYNTGMYYDYHIDDNPIAGVNTHYSMTCFLNDPNEYEGGELILKLGSKEIEYKLQKGKALIYSTGIKHKVTPVISGTRNVFICWIESAIKNNYIRNCLVDYGYELHDVVIEDDKIVNGKKFLEAMEHFRINLLREYAEF